MRYSLLLIAIFCCSTQALAETTLPDFSLYDPMDEQLIKTSSYWGQPTLLVFFSISEDERQLNIEQINTIQQRYSSTNLAITAIALDSDEKSTFRFIAKNRPNFRVLMPYKTIKIEPGETRLPLFLLLDSQLQIVKKTAGEATKGLIRAIEKETGFTR